MAELGDLAQELKKIHERNLRVEADKAWETSSARKAAISLGTYLLVLAFLLIIEASNPFLAALVPVFGFILSTLTLPAFKKIWLSGRKPF
jgi:hypothetical protein